MTDLRNDGWIARLSNIVLLLAIGLLTSCASLVGPRQVEIPLYKLQAGLDRRFPVDNRVLELFDIRLSRPQVSLLADSDRVALSMDAYVAPPFLTQSWSGRLALSGRLYIDVARGAVLMADPHVDQFVIDGMDEGRQRQLGKVAKPADEQGGARRAGLQLPHGRLALRRRAVRPHPHQCHGPTRWS